VNELQQLVREQQQDLRWGEFQPMQTGTVPLTEGLNRYLADSEFVKNNHRRARDRWLWSCPLHGQAYGRSGYAQVSYCSKCHSQACLRWRRRNKDKWNAIIQTYRQKNDVQRKEWQRIVNNPELHERKKARQRAYRARLKERASVG
jgi:hypothetical protein